MEKIKVLVVDDSALMRRIISDMINSSEELQVAGTARDGEELIRKIDLLRPQVITLDVEMPKLDGIQTLKELRRREIDVPVIMLSSVSHKGTQLTMECLEAGAFDFIAKPSGAISLDISKVKDDLIEKIKMASIKESGIKGRRPIISNRNIHANTSKDEIRKRTKVSKIDAMVIGASTGGPKALYTVITTLPAKLGVPIFVVQHMPSGFTKAFAERLNANSNIRVVEAKDGDVIENDVVYIAPGGFHMEISLDKHISLNTDPTIWGVRPAVDKLFLSASKVYGPHLVSAVLTGMGKDGAKGTMEVKRNGGITLSEDASTCTIYGMPKAAYDTGMVDEVLPIDDIAHYFQKLLK